MALGSGMLLQVPDEGLPRHHGSSPAHYGSDGGRRDRSIGLDAAPGCSAAPTRVSYRQSQMSESLWSVSIAISGARRHSIPNAGKGDFPMRRNNALDSVNLVRAERRRWQENHLLAEGHSTISRSWR